MWNCRLLKPASFLGNQYHDHETVSAAAFPLRKRSEKREVAFCAAEARFKRTALWGQHLYYICIDTMSSRVWKLNGLYQTRMHRGLIVKSPETRKSGLGEKGKRRLSCAVIHWRATGSQASRLSGRGGRRPGGVFIPCQPRTGRKSAFQWAIWANPVGFPLACVPSPSFYNQWLYTFDGAYRPILTIEVVQTEQRVYRKFFCTSDHTLCPKFRAAAYFT